MNRKKNLTPVYIMQNKFVIFISFAITVLFFMYKPLYSILIFVIFSYEHFLFISFVFNFLNAKKFDYYRCFTVSPLKTTRISNYEIWLKINEIYAYRRLYSMVLSKKKINLKSVLIAIVVIFFGLPLKTYKIIKFLVKQNVDLHKSLTAFYYLNYESVKDKKIEVYLKMTYLNGGDRKGVIMHIIKANPEKSVEEITLIYQNLVNVTQRFAFNNQNFNSEIMYFRLSNLDVKNEPKIMVPHYTNEALWKINGGTGIMAIHATSNVPKIIASSQRISIPIPGLIKPGSKNPGSVITEDGYSLKILRDEDKPVQSRIVTHAMYAVFGEALDSKYTNEFGDRNAEVIKIIGPKAPNILINAFSAGAYDSALAADHNKSYGELLTEIRDVSKWC